MSSRACVDTQDPPCLSEASIRMNRRDANVCERVVGCNAFVCDFEVVEKVVARSFAFLLVFQRQLRGQQGSEESIHYCCSWH